MKEVNGRFTVILQYLPAKPAIAFLTVVIRDFHAHSVE